MYRISEINIYPIKSIAGVSLENAEVGPRGFRSDRRWVIIDESNSFLSQRTQPVLTQFNTELRNSEIAVIDSREPGSEISLPLEIKAGETEKVRIWKSEVDALIADSEVNEWFTNAIGQNVRLAYMPNTAKRLIGHENSANHIVSFADAFPYHAIGEKSLEFLNQKLSEKVGMKRFRPNLVFSGGQAHDEDSWADLKIGNVPFQGIKNCGRCKVITLDPSTGEPNNEITKVLQTYRNGNNGIHFGRYLVAESGGNIGVGDLLSVGN